MQLETAPRDPGADVFRPAAAGSDFAQRAYLVDKKSGKVERTAWELAPNTERAASASPRPSELIVSRIPTLTALNKATLDNNRLRRPWYPRYHRTER